MSGIEQHHDLQPIHFFVGGNGSKNKTAHSTAMSIWWRSWLWSSNNTTRYVEGTDLVLRLIIYSKLSWGVFLLTLWLYDSIPGLVLSSSDWIGTLPLINYLSHFMNYHKTLCRRPLWNYLMLRKCWQREENLNSLVTWGWGTFRKSILVKHTWVWL